MYNNHSFRTVSSILSLQEQVAKLLVCSWPKSQSRSLLHMLLCKASASKTVELQVFVFFFILYLVDWFPEIRNTFSTSHLRCFPADKCVFLRKPMWCWEGTSCYNRKPTVINHDTLSKQQELPQLKFWQSACSLTWYIGLSLSHNLLFSLLKKITLMYSKHDTHIPVGPLALYLLIYCIRT